MELKDLDAELARLIELRARQVTGKTDLPTRKSVFPEDAKQRILRDVATVCDRLVTPCRVAFLGPLYSYTHLAAETFFGAGFDAAPVTHIASVFEEVQRQQADFGVVPIENSTDGRVVDTLENFSSFPVKICGEVELPIQHTLMAACARKEIIEVQSKAQALSQCRHWLTQHLPGAKLTEVDSTATAAKNARTKAGTAAIASPLAARAYGLKALVTSVSDAVQNRTRFVVLGKTEPERTRQDKTTLLFELPHEAGTLADALLVFKRHKINLTWIESFPIPETPGSYLFFVDCEGHRSELRLRRLLAQLTKRTRQLRILGSYPAAKTLGDK